MKIRKINTVFVFFLLIMMTGLAVAVPPMPMEFYGSAFLDGKPAPIGTVISAEINGKNRGNLTTTIDGFYGGPGIFDYRLKVFVNEEEYKPSEIVIVFKINGWQASQTAIYEPGKSTQLDLSSGETGAIQTGINPLLTPVPQQTLVQSSGISSGTSTISYGLDQEKIFSSEDGLAEVLFEKDTMVFSSEGQFLNVVGIRPRNIADIPPFPTEQTVRFSGYAYEIIPEGTYFNPSGILSFKLPPDRAYDIINSGPVIYEYLPQTASWEPVNTASNMFANTISADIYEAGLYGLFTPGTGTVLVQDVINGNLTPVSQVTLQTVPNQSVLNIPISTSGQPGIMPIVTPQVIITPQEIITPLPYEAKEDGVKPDIIVEPVQIEDNRSIIEKIFNRLPIPGLNLVTSITDGIKARLTGPIRTIIGFITVLTAANVVVYATYRYWWTQRK